MKIIYGMNENEDTRLESRCCISSQRRFTCPLTNNIMEDPVSAPCCGTNFERRAILRCLRKNGNRCPQSGDTVQASDLTPNATLQWEILYLERRNSHLSEQWNPKVSCFRPLPTPTADTPPSMPRSSPRMEAQKEERTKQSYERRISLNESTHSRGADVPPTLPRYSSSKLSSSPVKRMDSAPTLPRRSVGSINVYDILMSQNAKAEPQNEPVPASSGPGKSSDIITLLDDVLAVLSDDES